MYHNIRPGKTWYDTDGNRIQAHGGSILFANDTFFWYGENKTGITGTATGEKCPVWHGGVNLYSSKDLYNWKYEGVIMIDRDDPSGLFHPTAIMDRPHILYNGKNRQYVLFAKCAPAGKNFDHCVFGVCVADDIRGPFRFLHALEATPYGVGDFDMYCEGERAFILFENPHDRMIAWELDGDYTHFKGKPSEHLPRPCPPFAREAPAVFERGGVRFLLTSGTTGYYPNPTLLTKIGKDIHGEWEDIGDPCRGDLAHNSFHAQFSSVFRHPKVKDLYIALGDRWLTDLPVDLPDIAGFFERMFNPDLEPLPDSILHDSYSDENTSEADYVWLPIRFSDGGTPYIEWRDTWEIEDFIKK